MKMSTRTAIAAAILLTISACNESSPAGDEQSASEAASLDALNGTWKADLASLKFEGKPDNLVLQGGTYTCSTCIPSLTLVADGQFHPVADRPYYDSASVTVVDDRTVEFHRRKGGKEVSSSTVQVSADGNVLTINSTDATTPDVPPVESTSTSTRAGPGPAGAHAISGLWTQDRISDYSEDALNITYSIKGNTVTEEIAGQSFEAEIDGPAVAIKGDTGGTMVAVTREGTNGIRETYTRDGETVGISTIVPSADGKTFTYTSSDPRDGSKTTWTGVKAS